MADNEIPVLIKINGQEDPSFKKAMEDARKQAQDLLNATNGAGQAGGGGGILNTLFGKIAGATEGVAGLGEAFSGVGTIVAGIEIDRLINSALEAAVGLVKDLANGFKDVASYAAEVSDRTSIMQAQFDVMFRNLDKSGKVNIAASGADMLEFARRNALQAPFVDLTESAQAARRLAAGGLDPTKWLVPIQNTASMTATSLDDIEQKMNSVTYAVVAFASGASGRAIQQFRQLGINVREAGIEFTSTGRVIGDTKTNLDKLYTYLDQKFGGGLQTLNRQFSAIRQNVQDLFGQTLEAFTTPFLTPFRNMLADGFEKYIGNVMPDGNTGAEHIRAFFAVMGDEAGKGSQQVLDRLGGLFQEMSNGGNIDWAAAGANIVITFADGMVVGLTRVVEVAASIAGAIAGFLVGHSPPPEGPLSEIDTGGENTLNAWADGIEQGGQKAIAAANDVAARVAAAVNGRNSTGISLNSIFGDTNQDPLAQALPGISRSLGSLKIAGKTAAESYLDGFKTGFDLSPIQSLATTVGSILRDAASVKDIPKGLVDDELAGLNELLFRAALEIQNLGSVTQTTLSAINSGFGDMADNVDRVLQLTQALASVNGELADTQNAIRAVQDEIQGYQDAISGIEHSIRAVEDTIKSLEDKKTAIDDQIKSIEDQVKALDFATSEIPERYTRGRKREIEQDKLKLQQQKDLYDLQIRAERAKIDAFNKQIQAIRDLIEADNKRLRTLQQHMQDLQAQKQALNDLLKMEMERLKLIQQQAAAEAAAAREAKAKKAGDTRGYFDPSIGVGAKGLAANFEELKAKVKAWWEEVAGPKIAQLKEDWNKLLDTISKLKEKFEEAKKKGAEVREWLDKLDEYLNRAAKSGLWLRDQLDILFGPGGAAIVDKWSHDMAAKITEFFFWLGARFVDGLYLLGEGIDYFVSTTALGFQVILETVWEWSKDFVATVALGFETILEVVWGWAVDFVATAALGFDTIISLLNDWIVTFVTWLIKGAADWLEIIKKWADGVRADVTELVTDFKLDIKDAWDWMTEQTDKMAKAVVGFFDNIKTGITGKLGEAKTYVETTAKEMFDELQGFADRVAKAISDAFGKVRDVIGGLIDDAKRAISKITEAIHLGQSTPSGDQTPAPSGDSAGGGVAGAYADGGFVPATATYLLHAGEIVLNQSQQRNLLSSLGLMGAAAGGQQVVISNVWQVVPDLEDRLDLEHRMEQAVYTGLTKVLKGKVR